MTEQTLTTTPIWHIADSVERDWGKVNYAAKPYLDAMHHLSSLDDRYGLEGGASVVSYFLANAQSWRGETARAVKAELNRRLDEHYGAER